MVSRARADDELDDLVLGVVRDHAAADDAAVSQDREVGGDLEHLGDPVRDVDDRDILSEQLLDAIEEPARLLRPERLGRLIEHEHGWLGREGRCDLDQVGLAQRQRGDRGSGVDAQTELLEVQREPLRGSTALRTTRLRQQQQHGVEHRERRREGRRLVHDREAALARGSRLDPCEVLAAEADRARIRHDRPRGDPDERGLARTVLTEDRVDLPTHHRDAHVIEGAHTRVGLRDPSEGEDGVRHRRVSSHQPNSAEISSAVSSVDGVASAGASGRQASSGVTVPSVAPVESSNNARL